MPHTDTNTCLTRIMPHTKMPHTNKRLTRWARWAQECECSVRLLCDSRRGRENVQCSRGAQGAARGTQARRAWAAALRAGVRFSATFILGDAGMHLREVLSRHCAGAEGAQTCIVHATMERSCAWKSLNTQLVGTQLIGPTFSTPGGELSPARSTTSPRTPRALRQKGHSGWDPMNLLFRLLRNRSSNAKTVITNISIQCNNLNLITQSNHYHTVSNCNY